MNALTPFRFLWAARTADGRRRYYRALRAYYWERRKARGRDSLLSCRIDGGLRMRVNVQDPGISRNLYLDGTFEANELAFIRKVVGPGMIAVDVGANIGVHTLTLAKCVGDSGQVHAFEPSDVYERLADNVALNRFHARVVANHCAVGEADGRVQLVRCKPGYEAFTSRGQPLKVEYAAGDTFDVAMCSLDTYATHHNLQRIDFLKLDVEGSEPEVLKGADRLLANRAIRWIMLEVNETCLANCGFTPEELVTTLRSYGFDLQILDRLTGALIPCPDAPGGTWVTVVGRTQA